MAKKKAVSAADQRSYMALPLAQLVPGLTRAAYKKRSPAGALLMSEWVSIVGARLAAETEPRRLSAGQLTIACAGPMAMELQHLSGTLIERVNTHAGQKLVERVKFVQDRVAGPSAPPAPGRKVAPQPLSDLPPGPLNEALARLLAAIRTREGGSR